MQEKFELYSYAKINLFLKVIGKQAQGYHRLETLMLPIELSDRLVFEYFAEPKIQLTCSDSSLPIDQSNLVRKAAELLQTRYAPNCGAKITLYKTIPVGAGLGGGSSNGSTTLLGLCQLWKLQLSPQTLESLAAEFGSDTAFFIRHQPAFSEGRGEILTPIEFPQSLNLFLLNFGFGSSTAWAYKNFKLTANSTADPKFHGLISSLKTKKKFPKVSLANFLINDLEIPVFKKFPILELTKEFLLSQPFVLGAMMCGSGSTMMALLKNSKDALLLKKKLHSAFGKDIWTWSGSTLIQSDLKKQPLSSKKRKLKPRKAHSKLCAPPRD